jgi:hypothetical protein
VFADDVDGLSAMMMRFSSTRAGEIADLGATVVSAPYET